MQAATPPDKSLGVSVWMVDLFAFTPWYTAALTQALQRHGLRVRFISGSFYREPEYFVRCGLRHPARRTWLSRGDGFGSLGRAVRAGKAIWDMGALKGELRDETRVRPGVIHLQQMPLLNRRCTADLRLMDAAQRAGVAVVHTVHNVLPHDSGNRLRDIYRDVYQRVDALICHSADAAEQIHSEFAVPMERLSVIPHGPLFETQEAPGPAEGMKARTVLGLPAERKIVLWQGVLAPYKGLDTLLKAWELLLSEWDSINAAPLLVIAGSGPAKIQAMVRRAAERIGATVRADLRYIPSERIPEYFRASDVLVFPYHAITTSGALLTGLSYQKPIVASDLPPFREYLVDGSNSLLVRPGDAVALRDGMRGLLKQGGVALERLSQGAAQNRTRYRGWDFIAERTAALYSALLSAPVHTGEHKCAKVCTYRHADR